MIAGIIGIGILLIGMMGYIVGDIRTPPAPVSEPVLIVVTATPMPATPTSIPTIPPTALPTMQPIEPGPAPTEVVVQETWGVQIVIDTPVPAQPVEVVQEQAVQQVAAAPVVNTDLVYIQQAMTTRTIPPVDEATCSTYAEHKYENGICYIRGPLDAPGVWVAIGVEYPGFSCERSLFPGVSGSYDDGSKTCTVTYNSTTTRWSWTGSSWTLIG
jgi:hypothetical protein